jgi:hypothetical protein
MRFENYKEEMGVVSLIGVRKICTYTLDPKNPQRNIEYFPFVEAGEIKWLKRYNCEKEKSFEDVILSFLSGISEITDHNFFEKEKLWDTGVTGESWTPITPIDLKTGIEFYKNRCFWNWDDRDSREGIFPAINGAGHKVWAIRKDTDECDECDEHPKVVTHKEGLSWLMNRGYWENFFTNGW